MRAYVCGIGNRYWRPVGHTGISRPIEIRAPGFDMYSGYRPFGKPIDYPAARFYHTLRPFANWFIIIVASKWPTSADVRAISRAACRVRRVVVGCLSSGLSSARYVHEFILQNNPAGPSRDKSFPLPLPEFYLVIEFPGIAGVNVNAGALRGTTGCEVPMLSQ